MPISRFLNTTEVTIVKPGSVTSRYNDDNPDWDNPLSEVETTGWLTQMSTTEEIGSRNVVTTGWKLYLYPSEDIAAGDRVHANGSIYWVDGDPMTAPFGHHIECSVTYVAEVEPEAVS